MLTEDIQFAIYSIIDRKFIIMQCRMEYLTTKQTWSKHIFSY